MRFFLLRQASETMPQDACERAVAVVACPESFRLHLIFAEQFFVWSARLLCQSPTPSLPEHFSGVRSLPISLSNMTLLKPAKPSANRLHRDWFLALLRR